jgi:hypothetical protein
MLTFAPREREGGTVSANAFDISRRSPTLVALQITCTRGCTHIFARTRSCAWQLFSYWSRRRRRRGRHKRRRGRRGATTPTTNSATVNHRDVGAILELLSHINIATLSCGAISAVGASPKAPFVCIPSQPFNFLEITPVSIWVGTATVCAHPPPLQRATLTREACRDPIMELVRH